MWSNAVRMRLSVLKKTKRALSSINYFGQD
jgi:hypothetical protein